MKAVRIIASADDFLADLELEPLRAKARERGFAEETISATEAASLSNALETRSLFDAGKLVIVPDAADAKEPVLSLIARWAADPQPDVRLVLMTTTPASTKRLVKALGDHAQVVTPEDVPPWETPGWVVKRAKAIGKRMTTDAAKALVEALGTDLRELASAVDQLAGIIPDGGTIDAAAVSVQFRGIESKLHEFVDALFDRDRPQALRRLRALVAHGDHPLVVLAAIANQLRILAVLSGPERRSSASVAKELGIKEGRVKRAMRRSRNYTPDDLRRAYTLVADADLALKSEADDPLVLELLVDEIAGPARASRS